MDTRTLILFSLVPTAPGHLVNTLLMVPLLGTPLYLLMPWAAALFCLWAGGRCGRAGTRLLPALLLTQWLNVLCLGLYLWQFHFGDGTAPSLLLSGLAQAPGSCLSLATSWLVHRSLQPGFRIRYHLLGTSADAADAVALHRPAGRPVPLRLPLGAAQAVRLTLPPALSPAGPHRWRRLRGEAVPLRQGAAKGGQLFSP